MKIEEIPPIENVELEVKIAYGKINQLVDLVNSQQEAIERLQEHVDHEARHVSEPADNLADRIEKLEKRLSFFEVYGNPSSPPPKPTDNKIEYIEESQTLTKEQMEWIEERVNKDLRNTSATHRTVTLRIPKGMTIGRTILEAMGSSQSSVLSKSDTDLQKALDEVQPNE